MVSDQGYDKDVESLFEDIFADIGEADAAPEKPGIPGLIETLYEQESCLDPWRVALVNFADTLARCLAALNDSLEPRFDEMAARLTSLAQGLQKMPGSPGCILIRHRGRGFAEKGPASQLADFVILSGIPALDLAGVEEVAARSGPQGKGLAAGFEKAAAGLASLGINSVCFFLEGEKTADSNDPFNLVPCLCALHAYFNAPRHPGLDDGPGKIPVILDEKRKPGASFTMLAAVNNLKRGTMQVLINQADAMLRRAGARDPLRHYTGVYDALFAFKKLLGVLVRPRLEINNPRWLAADRPDELINEHLAGMARLVSREFSDSRGKPARILHCLKAKDWSTLAAWQVVDRLGLATELLDAIAISASGSIEDLGQINILGEDSIQSVLETVYKGLERLPDEVFGLIRQKDGAGLAADGPENAQVMAAVCRPLLEQVEFFSQRARVNKKMKSFLMRNAGFDDADYAIVAKDFAISQAQAEELVGLLAACFDGRGNFLRDSFERSIPAFCRHEKKVFAFLWHYLKEHVAKDDRIALLNSLGLLINRMKQPETGLGVLVEGFLRDPDTVTFSDRNAMMLANLLVRRFNKELLKEIRMTPEEVLNVRDGLDPDAATFVAGILDAEKERVFAKVRTIHKGLKAALNPYTWHDAMPLGYLLTLERETYILLSLVGGDAASSVLRSALWEYGNPDSEIYALAERKDQLVWLFHLLQLIVRGVGRVGQPLDAALLSDIKARESEFAVFAAAHGIREQLRRLMEWVEKAMP